MQPTSYMSSFFNSGRSLDERATCDAASVTVGNYLLLLDRHYLSPWKDQFETDSFDQILHRATAVGTAEQANSLYQASYCHFRSCPCRSIPTRFNLAKILRDGVESSHKWKLWLCLDCVKTDGEAYRTKACRVEHG